MALFERVHVRVVNILACWYFSNVAFSHTLRLFDHQPDYDVNSCCLKAIIVKALQDLHGQVRWKPQGVHLPIASSTQVGAAIAVDVLKCEQETPTHFVSILRLHRESVNWSTLPSPPFIIVLSSSSDVVKVWSALTLIGSYNSVGIAFRVLKVCVWCGRVCMCVVWACVCVCVWCGRV